MKVSVVIPVYNPDPRYLRQCLDSIVMQTKAISEILLVNDGSTRALPDFVHHFCFRIVSYPRNRGIGYARQRGLEAAKGEYVCFLSSDDAYEPHYLANMLRLARPNRLLFSDYYVCNPAMQIQSIYRAPTYFTQPEFRELCIAFALEKNMFVNFSSVFMPKDIADHLSFKPLRYGEDLLFLLDSLLLPYEWLHVAKPLIRYRTHPAQNTYCQPVDLWRQQWLALRDVLCRLGVSHDQIQAAMLKHYRYSYHPAMRLKRRLHQAVMNLPAERLMWRLRESPLRHVWRKVLNR